jgi:outer membrane receptor for ferrienterochelin and colicins
LDVNLFYTRFSNRITGDFLTDPQRIIYRNLDGFAISRGAGVNLDYQQGNWRGNMGFTFLDVFREEEGVRWPQLHAPAISGVGGLTYTSSNRHWVVDFTGKLTGPMYLPVVPNDYRPEKSPWFALLNLQVTYKSRAWEFYGGVKNLLNFIPDDPILRPFDPFDKYIDVNNPFGYTFDPSYNYAPMVGARAFVGWRYVFG